jgi:hypothetical protein
MQWMQWMQCRSAAFLPRLDLGAGHITHARRHMLTLPMLHELGRRLPPDSAYYRHGLSQRAWASADPLLGQHYQFVLNDPALGWNLPWAYARENRPMPLFIQNGKGLLLEVYNYIKHRVTKDNALALAHGIWLDPNRRPFLEALLLAADAKIWQLADWFNVTGKAIVFYTRVFYNVRERLSSPAFRAQIIGWFRPEDTLERRLKIAACRGGVAAVLAAVNLQGDPGEGVGNFADLIAKRAGQDAFSGVLQGLYETGDNAALKFFREFSMKSKDAAPPISDAVLSMSQAINTTDRFQQHVREEWSRRNAIARGEAANGPGAGSNEDQTYPGALNQLPECQEQRGIKDTAAPIPHPNSSV